MNRHDRRAAAARGLIHRPSSDRPRVCLSLICKDEEEVIERCLRSAMPLIDSWCIVDTGSTDKTMEIIRDIMKGIPGELVQEPWKDFGYNKTFALACARAHGEFGLLTDADDVFEVDSRAIVNGRFQWPVDFSADQYDLRVRYANLEYDRPHLVRLSKDFFYEGVRHEYLTCRSAFTDGKRVPGILYAVIGGGARSRDPEKYLHDAQALEETLKKDPGNPRTLYYIGQSYRDAGLRNEALVWFDKRGAMLGWPEETFMALFEAAKCRDLLGHDAKDVMDAYFRAWEARPTRAEPLYELARYLRVNQSRFSLAYQIAKMGLAIPRPPDDKLFVAHDVYAWRLLDEMAVSSFYIGRKIEGAQACRKLLKMSTDPSFGIDDADKQRIAANLAFCIDDDNAAAVLAGPKPAEEAPTPHGADDDRPLGNSWD